MWGFVWDFWFVFLDGGEVAEIMESDEGVFCGTFVLFRGRAAWTYIEE